MIDPDATITLWIRQCRIGDQSAFEQLYRCYSDNLVAFCRKKLGKDRSSFSEEDLAMETMSSIWEELTRTATSFMVDRDELWFAMMRVAKSKAIDKLRRARRLHRILREFAFKSAIQSSSLLEFDLEALRQALPNTKTQQILDLKLEGCSTEEICTRLELSERTFHRKSKLIRDVWEAMQIQDYQKNSDFFQQ
jgi:RNA polymerase sigma factor (sigma-70 family)